jgi:tight adherence protein B
MMPVLFSLLSSVFAGCFMYIMLEVFKEGTGRENRKIKSRVESLFLRKSNIERSTSFSSIFRLNQALKRQPLSKKRFTLLSFTGWSMPLGIFILGDLLWAAIVLVITFLVSGNGFLSAAVAAGMSLLPYLVLVVNKKRYVNRFTTVFPDALILIKSALRAGQGIQSAFKMVAKEGPQPVAREFAHMVHEIELGSQLTEALGELYRRIDTVDLRIFVLGIFIQNEIGGNMVELLTHIENTIRERLSMHREINVLSAQGKVTGTVLIMLPIGLAFLLWLMNPRYFDPLMEEEAGRKVFAFAVGMQMVGGMMIRKITSFRIG